MSKEDADPDPAWSAFKSATNLNKPSSLNHLSFQVTGTEDLHLVLLCSFSDFLAKSQGENSDLTELRANVTQQLSFVFIT